MACAMGGCIERTRKDYRFCDHHHAELKDKLITSGNESQESINEVLYWSY
jgi:hypothetical protein